MDKHSEIEVKFAANHVGPACLLEYLADNCQRFKLERYQQVAGDDIFYRHKLDTAEGNVIRHRCDGRRKRSVITVKQRKSATSIADRHEVDLPLADNVEPESVQAFLELTGWQSEFAISKVSYIAHLNHQGVHVCLALYSVSPFGKKYPLEWYLEAEIEKDADIDPAGAGRVLDWWVQELRGAFTLGPPLNESLYEIYRPKPQSRSDTFPGCSGRPIHDPEVRAS